MDESVIWPRAGRYILAVSGGIDSMTLLDLFARAAGARGYELMVAHYDHGIRDDSNLDLELVRAAAHQHGLRFEAASGNLGKVSEAVARSKRHEFLERVRIKHRAASIMTAHHQDDVIETSLLNLARGSGRRGLAPFTTGNNLQPLINLKRTDIEEYAQQHRLVWREDSTNADLTNPRNFLRRELISSAPAGWADSYIKLIRELGELNRSIDERVSTIGSWQEGSWQLGRDTVRDISLDERAEAIIMAVRRLDPNLELDRRLVCELALFARTGRSGRHRPIRGDVTIEIESHAVLIYSAKNRLR